jgi:hypothetical protein
MWFLAYIEHYITNIGLSQDAQHSFAVKNTAQTHITCHVYPPIAR